MCEIHDIPNRIKLEINQMIQDIIWEGKHHQRSFEGLTLDYLHGGLKLVSFYIKINTLRIGWLSTLMKRDPNSIEYLLANELTSNNKLK